MALATLPRYQWTIDDYDRMIAAGLFEKIELLCGDVMLTGGVVRPYYWTLEDYEQLIALGLLEGKHVELIQGEILALAPLSELHARTMMQLNYALLPHFNSRTGYYLRIQMPLALPPLTCEPEPDVAIVPLHGPTSAAGRPTSANLIVEVAELSLAYDRDHKGPLYAAAGIQEYGLINLSEGCIEVYRQPGPDPTSFSGWRYQELRRLRAGDQVSPLAAPAVSLAVSDLLPTR